MLFRSVYCAMVRGRKNAKLVFGLEIVKRVFQIELPHMLSPNRRQPSEVLEGRVWPD